MRGIRRWFTNWQLLLGIALITLSAIVYIVHYLIFRDTHHIFIYLIGDIAFVFFEVFLVTLVLHQLLSFREKKALFKKLNMVIGAFYSEVGLGLLRLLSVFDPNAASINAHLIVDKDWSEYQFTQVRSKLKHYDTDLRVNSDNLQGVKDFLATKRSFLLRLLENPNLLEHESFTNLLWAVFHLSEELVYRKEVRGLPDSDYQHLAGDIKRVYLRLISEWVDYLRHLQGDYPYLFSLAVRTNPFNPKATVIVQ